MPASKGTKARTTAVKRPRNTLVTPCLRINCALRSISQGKRLSGQPLSICRRHLRGNDPDFGELRLGERDCHCDCPPNADHAGVLRPFSACWARKLLPCT